MRHRSAWERVAAGIGLVAACATDAAAQIPLTSLEVPITQDFDSLKATGTSTTLPPGWAFHETGVNANTAYTASDGTNSAGDTYSLGAAGAPDRALGSIVTIDLNGIVFGASFVNQTGETIHRLRIQYTGEQYRLATTRREDRLEFQYSFDATGVADAAATWVPVPELNFASPTTLASPLPFILDGNAEQNRRRIAFDIEDLAMPPGATLWIRWVDDNVPSGDDALAIDDFSLTPLGEPRVLWVDNVSVLEGNEGRSAARFTVRLSRSPVIAPVTLDLATRDSSTRAPGGGSFPGDDYVPRSLQSLEIPIGSDSVSFDVEINGDVYVERDETLFLDIDNVQNVEEVLTETAICTIRNDDAGITAIHDVQGTAAASPLASQTVTVQGIVTAVKGNGFFVQHADAEADADPLTSEAVYVATTGAPPATVVAGGLVSVRGRVSEATVPGEPGGTVTQLGGTLTITPIAAEQPLPAPVELTPEMFGPTSPPAALERLESMRVHATSMTVVGPTGGTVSDLDATASSSGLFTGVLAGVPRPYREAGIAAGETLPSEAPCCVPAWDGNHERVPVNSVAQVGRAALDVASGASLSGVSGVLEAAGRGWVLLLDPGVPMEISGGPAAAPAPAPTPDEITLATLDLARLFDDQDAPGLAEPVLSPEVFSLRLGKASGAIREFLHTPDVVIVRQVEDAATLAALASRVGADAAAAGATDPAYQAFAPSGNDPAGLNIGVLVRTAPVESPGGPKPRLTDIVVSQVGAGETFLNSVTSAPEPLFLWPPLVVSATAHFADGRGVAEGTPGVPFTVVGVHLRPESGIAATTTGRPVRENRALQAEYLASLVQQRLAAKPEEPLLMLGNFNAPEFSDGYVDVVNTAAGTPPASDTLVRPTQDLLTPNLVNLIDQIPQDERYSTVVAGNAQTPQHALASPGLQAAAVSLRAAFARTSADFPATSRNDPAAVHGASELDPLVVYVSIAPAPPPPPCPPDFDGVNGVQVADIFAFLRAWFAGEARADFDGAEGIQVADIFAFLRAWFAGCP